MITGTLFFLRFYNNTLLMIRNCLNNRETMSFRERIEFINIIYSLFRVFIIYVFIIQFMITIDF